MFCVSLITHLILPTGRNMHSVVVVCRKFLTVPGVLTATSLRHPIARVMSLYWYEHVAWYNEVTHEMNKCKPLSEWVSSKMLSVMLFPQVSLYLSTARWMLGQMAATGSESFWPRTLHQSMSKSRTTLSKAFLAGRLQMAQPHANICRPPKTRSLTWMWCCSPNICASPIPRLCLNTALVIRGIHSAEREAWVEQPCSRSAVTRWI